MSTESFAAENLHPGLWRASQVGRPREAVFSSGFPALDEVLPGGGWPASSLTELLLPHPGVGEMRLLAPVLVRLQREQHGRCMMWFDPPARPSAWALHSLGLSTGQLVVVHSQGDVPLSSLPRSLRGPANASRCGLPARSANTSHSALWALEHALRSGHVGAVLAWLPARLPADALRRLQLAAQAHEGPAFLLRGEAAARQSSPAPLRLQLAAAAPDWLSVSVFKRRGPPLSQPLLLELASVLGRPAQARARAGVVQAPQDAADRLPADVQPSRSWA